MINERGESVITLYTLKTCNKCKELKNELDREGIEYHESNLESNPDLADIVENTFKCKSYPMVYLSFKSNVWKIWLPESSLLPSTSVAIYNSIPELVKTIKSIIKK